MEWEQLTSNARWEILKQLAHNRATATDLATTTKTSLPNISQQLKLLEAYNLIEHVRDRKGQGKPAQVFGIKQEFCNVTFVRPGLAEKRFFNPDPYHTALLNVLLLPSMQDHAYLHKYLLIDELTTNCAIAFLKSNEHELEVLLLTDHLDLIRAKYSNTIIEHHGKPRKLIAWSHSLSELNEGLSRKESYFENLCKNPIPLHDPKNQFDKIKKK